MNKFFRSLIFPNVNLTNSSLPFQVNDFRCVCTNGYDGKDCSHDIDDCASSPCFKGSTCVDGIAEYKCNCMSGMTGRNCEIDIGITIMKFKSS